MKTLLASLVLVMSMSVAQASPYTPFAAFLPGAMAVSLFTLGDKNDSRMFKTVDAAWADNKDGYSFTITQFEYDQNPSKYVLK